MKVHLNKEIDGLKKNIQILSSMVEGAVRNSVVAVIETDPKLAERVIDNDILIDQKEIEIEEECLKILALHQPVAGDLRYVVACIKVNNELERIGDLGANIAKRVKHLCEHNGTETAVDFKPMMDVTRSMLKSSLDSLICMNGQLAAEIIRKDDIVDDYNRQMFIDLQELIKENPEKTEYYVDLLNVSRHLERIADCTTNICEDIIYMIKGEIIRHGHLN
ncbi:MAG: phosphate signaling complex protein PhoU [Lentisphaerae bacterium]|nr:phosphate signaling complex protein PhoU [Lentisphaerota bacterium]MCP4101207.1 phosphate signaling complex protein PhoU [Lentisphaerota bacterium]